MTRSARAAGDAVLSEFARRLVNTVRGTETVARLAGDEFMIILDLAGPQAKHVAGKIALAVHADFLIEGHTRMVTSSIGVALFEGGAMTPGEWVARADAALFSARDAGRNGYRVAPAV